MTRGLYVRHLLFQKMLLPSFRVHVLKTKTCLVMCTWLVRTKNNYTCRVHTRMSNDRYTCKHSGKNRPRAAGTAVYPDLPVSHMTHTIPLASVTLCLCAEKKKHMCERVWCLTFTHTHTRTHNGNPLLWLMKLQIVYVISRDSELFLQSCVPALVPSPFCFYPLSYVRSYSISVCTRFIIILHKIQVLLGVPSPQVRSPSSRKGETKNN